MNTILNTTLPTKLRFDVNKNITNNFTGYFNYFTRDWFKLDKVVLEAQLRRELFNSSAASVYQILERIAQGLEAGQLR